MTRVPAAFLRRDGSLTRRVVLAMIKRRAAAAGLPASDLLPHVPRDGDHGVPVERGNAGARAAERGARVAEDDEALRPDGGHDDGRRRTHRDLNGLLDHAQRVARPVGQPVGAEVK